MSTWFNLYSVHTLLVRGEMSILIKENKRDAFLVLDSPHHLYGRQREYLPLLSLSLFYLSPQWCLLRWQGCAECTKVYGEDTRVATRIHDQSTTFRKNWWATLYHWRKSTTITRDRTRSVDIKKRVLQHIEIYHSQIHRFTLNTLDFCKNKNEVRPWCRVISRALHNESPATTPRICHSVLRSSADFTRGARRTRLGKKESDSTLSR